MSQNQESSDDESEHEEASDIPSDGKNKDDELLINFEDRIIAELCEYQARVELGGDGGDSHIIADFQSRLKSISENRVSTDKDAEGREIPPELRATLEECKRFLQFLNQVRATASNQIPNGQGALTERESGKTPFPNNYIDKHVFGEYGTPSHIGRYVILQQLGSGGFGIVFHGIDPNTHRDVAIKIPRPEMFASQDLIARFEREAQIAGQLEHRNIVPIYDSDLHGATPYIVSKYIDGPTLSKWKISNDLPAPRVSAEIVQLLSLGVAHAHDRGVLHRDLKPGNVMLAPCDEVIEGSSLRFVPMLTDFGMAKLAEPGVGAKGEGPDTKSGSIIGTLGYMAPEQAEGRNRDITARSDVYGLGAILFELLVGTPPYHGENDVQTMQNIMRNDPLSPKLKQAKVPLDLEVICLKALEIQPNHRFSSAKELGDELERFLLGLPIQSRPIAPISQIWRWCRRQPALAGLISLFIAFVSFVLINNATKQRDLIAYNRDLERLNRQSKASSERASQMQQIAEQNARKANDTAYASDIGRVAAAWGQGDSRTMVELLDRYIPQAGEEDRRGFEWWYLRRQITVPGRLLADVGAAVYVLRQTSDGKLMAASGADSTVRVFDPNTGEIRREIPTGQVEINGTSFNVGVKLMATAGDDGTIRILNYETGEERAKIETPFPKVYGVRVSPVGSQLIACGTAPFICVFDTGSGKELYRLEGHTKTVQNMEVTSNGMLFSNSNDGSIRVWDLSSRKNVRTFQSEFDLGPFVLRPGGKYVAAGTTLGGVLLVDTDAGILVSSIGLADGIGALAFDPSGSRLAIGDASGRISIRSIDPDGRIGDEDLAAWQGHRTGITALRWRGVVDSLVSGDREGKIFNWNFTRSELAHGERIPSDSRDDFGPFSRRPLNISLRSEHLQRENESVRLPPRQPGKLYRQFCYSSDGRYLAAVTERGALQLFLTPDDPTALIDGNRIAELNSGNQTEIVGFSSDLPLLAVVEYLKDVTLETRVTSQVSILRLPTLEVDHMIPIKMVRPSSAATDGRRLVYADPDKLYLWDFKQASIVWQVPQKKAMLTTFSSDGMMIAVSDMNRVILIRNAVDGTVRIRCPNMRAGTHKVRFAPDGRTLISASHTTVRFTHIATGQELMQLTLPGGIHRIEFSPDGKRLICQITPPQIDALKKPDEIVIIDSTEVVME